MLQRKSGFFNPGLAACLFFACMLWAGSACFHQSDPPRILVFSKTEGYRHESIPNGVAALRKLCRENGMLLDSTEDASAFNEKNLKRYAAIVFLCTTGDVLDPLQENAFERYIQAGGGYVGIHSATDTEYGWKWYGDLSGAYFQSHPAVQQAKMTIHEHDHPATRHLKGDQWIREDEWYDFKQFNPAVKVLLSLDESSYQGAKMCATRLDANPCHPISWYHEYDGGRAFYTGLGHTKQSYTEPEFLAHLLGGLKYAIGGHKRLAYEKCRTPEVPDPTRFVKTVLASDLTEPMEIDMLPDGKVLLIERRGAIKLFDPQTGMLNIVCKLDVHSELEDGLLGMALDPAYEQNHWIYLYYSPPGDRPINVLSRFVFTGDTLDRASEKILLTVDVQREECCHAAGCVEFDAAGNLYLSTGDNTNPFASDGYSPSDERPGRSAWDAQKSSANTMDLRGKILRIRPQPDGTYTCPADNLFNDGQGRGRPEIYVMGCRNPFRLSYDDRRKLLFWGEVGPDAGEPDTARGPAGHDEVNRARAAGFFGWPYFVGDNKPYREHNFASGANGPAHDPLHPINNSPFNTGARELPPAQPAMIWYPYGNSPEFPLVGNGGRNAMAGPVYYCDQYPADTRLPDYYNGKLITYEWMRGWMMAVTLDSLGNMVRMEPFADSIRLSRPTDMIVDKNGSIWVIEYGKQWFSSNPDARLSRIDYVRGNRPPIPHMAVTETAGAAPFEAVFSLKKTRDYDDDKLVYQLDFGDDTPPLRLPQPVLAARVGTRKDKKAFLEAQLDSVRHTYARAGLYEAILTVTDPSGQWRQVRQKISVGNAPPVVRWDFNGKNRSFYRSGDTLHYTLQILDPEDGTLASGRISAASVATSMDYLEGGFDITSIAQGHQTAQKSVEYARGKQLIDRSDCATCHAVDRRINGPSFQAVAARYRGDDFAVRNLSQKIIKGGAGNWGETVMSAHPLISEEDAGEMVRWILSLGDPPKAQQAFPVAGAYPLQLPPPKSPKDKVHPGTFILQASYRDRGSSSQGPQSGSETIALRPAFQQAEQADSMSRNIRTYRPENGDTVVLNELKHRSFFLFRHCDLDGILAVSVGIGSGDKRYQYSGGRIELHLDAPDGPLLGQVGLDAFNQPDRMQFKEVQIPLNGKGDGRFHDLYFVLKNEKNPAQAVTAVDWVRFEM